MKRMILRMSFICAAALGSLGLILSAPPVANSPFGAIVTKEAFFSEATISTQEHNILVVARDGYVAVYENNALTLLTDIPISSLPATDRIALEAGIVLEDEQALHSLLEDLGA